MTEKDVIIIGAGLTGLTTAHYLNKAGASFAVLESNGRVGGVINTVKKNGFVYEEGPNTGVLGNADAVELFEELKGVCTLEKANSNVKKRYILKSGEWKALPSGLVAAIKTNLFSTKDKFRILLEPFRKRGTKPNETLAELVLRRMGKSFLEFAIDPFILGVYAGDPSLLVPKYALPKLYNLEQDYGSFIGGAIKKKFQKKDEREKKVTREVFSAEGGLSELAQALYKSAGEKNFHLNSTNISVNPDGDDYVVVANIDGGTVKMKARNVISTVGAYELPEIFPFIDSAELQNISLLHYTKVVEVALGFNTWEGIELDGFGGLIPFKENRDILGVLFISSLLKNRAPETGALLSVFIGGVRKEELAELPDEKIREIITREVSDLMQLNHFNPDLFEVTLYSKAIPQYYKDSGQRFETVKNIEEKFSGLIIGGNLKDGIGMADRIRQGKEMASRIQKL